MSKKNDDEIHVIMAMQLVNEAYFKLNKHMIANRPISIDIFLMDVVTRGINDILTNQKKTSLPVEEATRLHNILQEM